MRNLITLLFLTLTAAPAAGQDGLARVDAYVTAEMARQKIPGLAVAIVRKGEPVKLEGYGFANVEHDVPVTPDTIFQSGSVGKQFTAAAVLLLVEEGKLALEDPLTKFFPDAPTPWQHLTVRHLLTHTSGLPDYTAGTIDYRRDYSEDDLRTFAYGLSLEFEPGSRWNYSNTGYVLLGIIVRNVTGQFYGDVLRDRVFAPLGMKTARVIDEASIVRHRAAGYTMEDGELRNQDWVAPKLNTTADGSLYLSLRDMVAWDAGLRARKLLSQEGWKAVLSPVRLNSGRTYPYGFGWDVAEFAGRRAERHGGSWQGFMTYIARYPDDDLTIIVLANAAHADPGSISSGIAAILDPTMAVPEPAPMADTNAAAQARVRQLLASAAAGTLAPAEFAYVRAGFFPGRARRYKEMLGPLGPVTSLTLLSRRELGDDTVHVYDAAYASGVMRVRAAIAPDGKLAALDIYPRPAR
ncbi:MAG: beta-lactamase family protein [Acidobacteriota bacterium]|nr:beta-lactamase family protein [Acidobacteriota bacterium]